MDMNLFDKILLAASHPVTRQQSSEILLWVHDLVEGVEMPRPSLKYTVARIRFVTIFLQLP